MSRSMQMSFFSGLRQASCTYIPAHSKNGVNVSQRLLISAYQNIASRANGGDGRSEAIPFTIWGKGADVLALCLTPGKEFTCFADLHIYQGRVYTPSAPGVDGTPITLQDGTPLTTKKFSFTIRQFDLGNDSHKHIMREIQAQVRGEKFWMQGHPDYENFRALLKARMSVQFDPNSPTFGFARIRLPQGAGIGAWIQGQSVDRTAQPDAVINAGNATDAAVVAKAFGGAAKASTPGPVNAAQSFQLAGV